MFRTLAGLALVLALVLPASAEPRHSRGGGWHGGHGGHGSASRGYGYRRGDPGTAFWGGVLGGVLGTWWSQADRPTPPVYPEESVRPVPWSETWFNYCSNRYRSFNPQTGQYLGYDGLFHDCR